MTSGMTDLAAMLRTLRPEARDGEWVYAVVDSADAVRGLDVAATVAEAEGLTVVLPRAQADRAGIAYDFVAAWITLTVHSSLEAIGLTAAIAAALRDAGIGCNVLAGAHHDHILVPVTQRDAALAALAALSEQD